MAELFAWTRMLLFYFIASITLLLIALYLYFTFVFTYWKKRGIPYATPSFPFGNIGETLRQQKHIIRVLADIYSQLEGHKIGGYFEINRPTLMIRDINVVKDILMKNFSNFHDRGMYYNEETDPLMGMLFALRGQKWKSLRAKLTPTFTSLKMKGMYQNVYDCAQSLKTATERLASQDEILEVTDLLARYTTDMVASCAFGIQCNCLSDPDAEFRQMGRDYFERGRLGKLALLMSFHAPELAEKFNLGTTPRHVAEFFLGVVRDTIAYREKNNVRRNDFMQLMIHLKNQGNVDGIEKTGSVDILTYNEIASQAFMFYLAGFETSSVTMAYALYELSLNVDLQTRLREEIRGVLKRHGADLTYDALMDMTYLEMVILETSRLRPIIGLLSRVCTEEYRVPDSDMVVEAGTPVVIPAYSIHHDPQFYPDPEKFDPERFTAEQNAKRNPYTYLPFGEGPRICIGTRFAMMQMKAALATLISNFEVSVCARTVVPPVMNPQDVFMTPRGGLYLRFTKL